MEQNDKMLQKFFLRRDTRRDTALDFSHGRQSFLRAAVNRNLNGEAALFTEKGTNVLAYIVKKVRICYTDSNGLKSVGMGWAPSCVNGV